MSPREVNINRRTVCRSDADMTINMKVLDHALKRYLS